MSHKLRVDGKYFLNVPDWFIDNRYNGIIGKSGNGDHYEAREIADYKWMSDFMSQFSKDKIFLDIGAQMGLSTMPVASQGYKVIAVEPVKSNLDLLMSNVSENGFNDLVTILPFAAHHEVMIIDIFVPSEEDCASLSEAAATRIGKPVTVQKVSTVVMYNVLPLVCEDLNLIKFIKIDVQGAEIDVLRGMKDFLSDPCNRCIFIEWDPTYMRNYGYEPEELDALLQSYGYHKIESTLGSGDNIYTNQ